MSVLKIGRTVIISGSPGLEDEVARRIRRAKDDSRARILKDYGLQSFLEEWYAGELWKRWPYWFYFITTLNTIVVPILIILYFPS